MANPQQRTKRRKRKSDEVKIQMLRVLEDGKAHTFSRLSRVLGTSYSTVTSNCDFLRMLGLVEIASIAKQDSASGRSYSHVRITRKGRAWLDELADK